MYDDFKCSKTTINVLSVDFMLRFVNCNFQLKNVEAHLRVQYFFVYSIVMFVTLRLKLNIP